MKNQTLHREAWHLSLITGGRQTFIAILTLLSALMLACTSEAAAIETSALPDRGESSSVPSKPSPPETEQGESNGNPIVISARDLAGEYEDNLYRFEQKYGGRWVKVKGKVRSIGEGYVVYKEFSVSVDSREDLAKTFLAGLQGETSADRQFSAMRLLPAQPGWVDPQMAATVGEPLTLTCRVQIDAQAIEMVAFEGCHIYP